MDYLTINVTVSPLYDMWFGLVNETGDSVGSGGNFTRSESGLNASALWNASGVNSSYVWVNDSGFVHEERFNHTDSNQNWTNVTLDFGNYTLFPIGGNVSVKLKAIDSFYQQNFTRDVRYFYLWSNASIGSITVNGSVYDENITIVNGTTHLVSCFVNDTYSGQGIPGYNVSFYINGSFNSSGLTNSSGWANFVYTDATPEDGNYSVLCNITDDPEVFYNASADNTTNTTVYVIGDGDKPGVSYMWFEYKNGQELPNITYYYYTGYYTNITVVMETYDPTSYVTSVILNVTYGGMDGQTSINHTMTEGPDGLWRLTFDNSGPTRSVNSSLYFIAYPTDAGGNTNNLTGGCLMSKDTVPASTLYANSTLYINLTEWEGNDTPYNRGENLTFFASDVNWFPFETANWSMNISKYGESVNTSLSSENVTYFNYTINSTDPVGVWTLWPNASFWINNGSANFNISVTDQLESRFVSPSEGDYFPAGSSISPKVSIFNAREKLVPWNMTYVQLHCPSGDVNLTRNGDSYVLNGSDTCKAVNTPGSVFQLDVEVSDPYNNYVSPDYLDLHTNSESDSGTTTRTSSSSYMPPLACNCTEWEDKGCGSGNCTADQMYQERVCTPAGCEAESRCIEMSVCTDRKNFNVTSKTDTVQVVQGMNATAIFTVENTGNKDFELDVVTDLSCCPGSAFPGFSSFGLPQKTQVTVPVAVHVPLSVKPGEYVLTVTFAEKEFNKSAGVRVVVTGNSGIQQLAALESGRDFVKSQIDTLVSMGIDVTGLRRRFGQLEKSISDARMGIQNDNAAALSQSLAESQGIMQSINDAAFPARLQGFLYTDWAYIATEVVTFLLMLYMLMEVITPPLTLNSRIRKLDKRLKDVDAAGKETERQWTQRKIDDTAFRDLIQKRKDEKNMIISELKRLRQEAEVPIESRLSPIALGRWLASGPRRIIGRRKKPKPSGVPNPKAPAMQKETVSPKYREWQRKYMEAKKKDDGKGDAG